MLKWLCALPKKIAHKIYRYFVIITEDQLAVYAAQATFFIIVSSIPFIILLLGLAKYVIDINWLLSLIDRNVDGQLGALLSTMVHEVVDNSGASLLSFTIITTLWSASRGVNAVAKGISEAYKVHLRENFLLDILRSFIYTFVFIFIIIASLLALVFAETIYRTAQLTGGAPMLVFIIQAVYRAAPIVLTVILSLFFAAIFNTVAKKGRRFSRAEYKGLRDKVPRGFLAQLPGAIFASLGWVVFSIFFSLYFRFFPEASYIYGSLTTIMLLMLWMYFVMFIFMLGAEINKYVFNKWDIGKHLRERAERKRQKKKKA
ncbi:MAG: YihY/virulence factor BrkB family protein [Ruminococcaceae bacterium]|nr:YihY/virulence factor BrkB family protein [Oscillospiraceae bacterium]